MSVQTALHRAVCWNLRLFSISSSLCGTTLWGAPPSPPLGRRQMGLSASDHSLDNIDFDNKEDDQHDQRLLSQFGIWFLVGVAP